MADINTRVLRNGIEGPLKQGALLPIDKGSTDRLDTSLPGYDGELAEKYISHIRTDLNRFTNSEIEVLENHGYLLANRVIKRHASELVLGEWPMLIPPHPNAFDPEQVRAALVDSDCRFWTASLWRRVKRGIKRLVRP